MGLHLDKDTAIYIGIASTIFAWLILAPIVLYHTYNFYKSRNEDYIAKRHPNLVLITNFSLIIDSLLVRPFSVYINIKHNNETSINGQLIFDIGTLSKMIAWTVLFTSLLLNVRLFSTYYDWTKSKHLLSAKWKSQTIFNQQETDDCDHYDNDKCNNGHYQNSIKLKNKIPWTMTKYGRLIGNTKLLITISLIWFIIAEICVMYVILSFSIIWT